MYDGLGFWEPVLPGEGLPGNAAACRAKRISGACFRATKACSKVYPVKYNVDAWYFTQCAPLESGPREKGSFCLGPFPFQVHSRPLKPIRRFIFYSLCILI